MKRRKEKVKQFAKELLTNNFDRNNAIMKVSPNISKESAYVKSCRWINSDDVKLAIAEELKHFDSKIITKDYVYMNIHKLILDKNTKDSTKAMLLSILSKCLSMSSDTKINLLNIVGDNKLKDILT